MSFQDVIKSINPNMHITPETDVEDLPDWMRERIAEFIEQNIICYAEERASYDLEVDRSDLESISSDWRDTIYWEIYEYYCTECEHSCSNPLEHVREEHEELFETGEI